MAVTSMFGVQAAEALRGRLEFLILGEMNRIVDEVVTKSVPQYKEAMRKVLVEQAMATVDVITELDTNGRGIHIRLQDTTVKGEEPK
jgi:hypothetical protein